MDLTNAAEANLVFFSALALGNDIHDDRDVRAIPPTNHTITIPA